MPDGPVRKLIKKLLRAVYLADLRLYRAYLRARRENRYELAGTCRACAKCCEEPSIIVHPIVWHVRPLQVLFVQWQWFMNRFAFVRSDPDTRTLTFECAHFDRATRRCDSYDSRPGICWDYPRFQLDRAWPDLHAECGYRAVDRNAAALARALDQAELTPEAREELKRKLHVLK